MGNTATNIVPGTYARTADGRHIYHSDTKWNDPSYALEHRRSEWRLVTGTEHAALWRYCPLSPGESWEADCFDMATQSCRDCGQSFPYTEDADYCPECVADMHPEGGITPEGTELGHRYVMGNVNCYCPKCSEEYSEREGRSITVLDCDYDLSK